MKRACVNARAVKNININKAMDKSDINESDEIELVFDLTQKTQPSQTESMDVNNMTTNNEIPSTTAFQSTTLPLPATTLQSPTLPQPRPAYSVDSDGFCIPKKAKHIARKRTKPQVLPHITTRNRYETATSMDSDTDIDTEIDSESETTKKTEKIPPIVIANAMTNPVNFFAVLMENTKATVHYKCTKNTTIAKTDNKDDFENVKKYLKEHSVEFHTYTPNSDRENRTVVKGVPTELTELQIMNSLIESKVPVVRVSRLFRTVETNKVPLDICIVVLEPGCNLGICKKVRYLYNAIVRWENYKPKNRVLVCTVCLGYDHSGRNCYKKQRCRRCGQGHTTEACKATAAKCINCKGEHATGSRECPHILQKLQEKKTPRAQQKAPAWRSTAPWTTPTTGRSTPPSTSLQRQPPGRTTPPSVYSMANFPPLGTTGRKGYTMAEAVSTGRETQVSGNVWASASANSDNNRESGLGEIFSMIKDIIKLINIQKMKLMLEAIKSIRSSKQSTIEKFIAIGEVAMQIFV